MEASEKRIARFRAFCLGLPETSETFSWGHPNFRAGKKTFATVEWVKGRPSLAFKLGAKIAEEIDRQNPQAFLTPYGRREWLSVWIDGPVDWQLVRTLVVQSY